MSRQRKWWQPGDSSQHMSTYHELSAFERCTDALREVITDALVLDASTDESR